MEGLCSARPRTCGVHRKVAGQRCLDLRCAGVRAAASVRALGPGDAGQPGAVRVCLRTFHQEPSLLTAIIEGATVEIEGTEMGLRLWCRNEVGHAAARTPRRRRRETPLRHCQAESIALMVGAGHGSTPRRTQFPTSTWAASVAGKSPVDVVQATAARVGGAALGVLDQLDTAKVADRNPPGLPAWPCRYDLHALIFVPLSNAIDTGHPLANLDDPLRSRKSPPLICPSPPQTERHACYEGP